jgi:predicted TPR repeat methyltransferase
MTSALDQARDRFFEGIRHFEDGRLEDARTAFEASLTLAPGRPSVLGNLGITLYHLQCPDQAIPVLQAATAADPANAEAWTCLAFAHEAGARWNEAAAAFREACALSPQKPALWFRKGQCHMRLGRVQDALGALDKALEIDPAYAEAWSARGGILRELQRLDEAAACFEKALASGGDPDLNGYYLASVRGGGAPPPPPRRYVESLFDDYAADFQGHVVGQLRYEGYRRLLQPLADAGRQFHYALDLGCGTGLCAPLLKPLATVIDGVDISQAMLAQARRLGIYRALHHADITQYLEAFAEAADKSADLVVAADVFIYVGDLNAVFRAVRRILAPAGSFVFTVEMPARGEGLQLQPSLRYAHSEAYVRQLARTHDFKVESMFRAPIRHDQARPLDGLYVYLR